MGEQFRGGRPSAFPAEERGPKLVLGRISNLVDHVSLDSFDDFLLHTHQKYKIISFKNHFTRLLFCKKNQFKILMS